MSTADEEAQQPLLEKPKFRWSFSQWESYNSCPQRWKFQSVMKLPRKPPGPAAARGLEIHASVEEYIKTGTAANLHGAVKSKFIPIFDEIRNHPNGDRYCEKKLGFDSEWSACPPHNKNAACIAILDAVRFGGADRGDKTARVYEWKSGSPKDTHGDQRKLYAVAAFLHWPATAAEVTTYYLEDTAPPQKLSITPSGAEKLKVLWNERIAQMQRDEFCAPRPGIHCNWCDYARKRGGPCRFGA